MDNEFKVPTFEPKLKVAPKKIKPQTEGADVPIEVLNISSEAVEKEPESAKVETETPKVSAKCPYIEPTWSKVPESNLTYNFEVLKGGQIVENVKNLESKAFWTVGKLPNNDIVMAHPTISRYHAVLQYRPEVTAKDQNNSDSSDDDDDNASNSEQIAQKPQIEKGWYLYDLNSTHGSFVNKMKVPPKTYVRLRVGYMLKFGASTRIYILQGPDFDEEAESELTITEMKELKLKKEQEAKEKLLEEEKRIEEQGISWGMTDDADEETDLSHNPFASTNNEDLFLQDPKKTLRGYFEREGLDLDYKVDEVTNGTYTCRIELPITDSMGRSIMAEFTHKGKKKECVAQCALEACRILDRNGLLRQATHEPRKRKVESSDDDDDDEFYDRTTEAEEKRRRKAGTEESVTLSYKQLLEEEKKLHTQLLETEQRIERYQQFEKASKEKEAMDVDDLDDFMSGLSSEKQMDKAQVRKCRFELQRIKMDIQKVKKLINITRPIDLPPLMNADDESSVPHDKQKMQLPLFGKKKSFGFDKLKQQVSNQKVAQPKEVAKNESIEEFDDDDADVDPKASSLQSDEKIMAKETESNEEMRDNGVETTKSRDEPTIDCISELTSSERTDTKEKISEQKLAAPKKSTDQLKPVSSQLTADNPIALNESNPVGNSKSISKHRNRNKVRQQIDIDDTEEDTSPQKYSGWIPPSNQSGDGITDLNSKYGY